MNGYNYYIPLSSPKNSDYRLENGVQKIRGIIIPIIRITSQSSSGKLELKRTLKLSNMIPVPASELTLYDMEHEQDLFYKALIHKEMLFIRKNKNKIIQHHHIEVKRNTTLLYKPLQIFTIDHINIGLCRQRLLSLCHGSKNAGISVFPKSS